MSKVPINFLSDFFDAGLTSVFKTTEKLRLQANLNSTHGEGKMAVIFTCTGCCYRAVVLSAFWTGSGSHFIRCCQCFGT